MNKFWMVWGPNFKLPEVRHLTRTAADAEAARLAMKHPGWGFIVLESIGHYKKDDPLWEPHT